MHEPSLLLSTPDLQKNNIAEPATARPCSSKGEAVYLLRPEICLHSLYQLLSVGFTIGQ